MEIRLYEVKLVKAWSYEKGGKSFCIPSTSREQAVESVLNIEPFYNPEWGIRTSLIKNGKRIDLVNHEGENQ